MAEQKATEQTAQNAQAAVDTIVAEVAAAGAPLSTDVTIEALLERVREA